jgi:hypothetical protein
MVTRCFGGFVIKYIFYDAMKEPSELIYVTDFKGCAINHYLHCLYIGAKLQVTVDGFLLCGSPEEILKKF